MKPYTRLVGRLLWFDGDETIKPQDLVQRILKGGKTTNKTTVTEMDTYVEQYNKLVPASQRIRVKDSIGNYEPSWNLPDAYLTKDMESELMKRLEKHVASIDPSMQLTYIKRYRQELSLYKQCNLMCILRTIHYIVDTLYATGNVWGVGRGSSVSSYLLYLLEAHDIDPVMYDLDIHDFIRKENT